jgi:hypothetical protein
MEHAQVPLRSRTGLALIAATVLVPVLIGATGGRGYGDALIHGYQPAMIVMAALCVAAAVVTALFVSDSRVSARRVVPRAPEAGCAVCTPQPAPQPALTQEVMS